MFENLILENDQTLNIIDNFSNYIEKEINTPLPFSLEKEIKTPLPFSLEKEELPPEKTTKKHLLQMFPKEILESETSIFYSWKKSINYTMTPEENKKLAKIRRTALNRVYAKKSRSLRKYLPKPVVSENNYECNFCNYKTFKDFFLQVHLRSHRNKSGKFDCTECGKIYNRSYNLIKHFKHVHPEIYK